MRAWKTRKVLTGAAIVVGAAGFLLPSLTWSASADDAPVGTCLQGSDKVGGSSYHQTTETVGKKKRAVTTVTGGTFIGQFSIQDRSCKDAIYAITITTADGSAFDWLTITAPAGATATPSADHASVVVAFPGDGETTLFEVSGAMSGYLEKCVASTALISVAGVTVAEGSSAACSGDSGGGNYF